MKRMISLLLAFVLVAALFPALHGEAEAKTGGKLVAITFEDGPSAAYTEQLLDGLKERGVKATFFMLGELAQENREIVKRAYEEGHEIACHSWDHADLSECSDEELEAQIADTFAELDLACGEDADYLVRLPYAEEDERVLELIDVPVIGWSVDSSDGSLLNAEKVSKKIVEECYDGCIILCHDILRTTIPAALDAIDALTELGYEFVTVSELYRRRGVELEAHTLYTDSPKNGVDLGPIPAPVITVKGDPKGENTVTITCADGDAPIYYTLDGSWPNEDASLYTGPFTVEAGTEIIAVAAWKLNGSRSELSYQVADDILVVAPTITLNADGDVVMATPTADAEIYFTVDDTAPTADSLLYTGPELIVGGCFLRAVTIHETGRVSAEKKVYLSEDGDLYYDIYAGQWFYDAMDWAHRMEILNGTAPYTMTPAGVVTRGMLVTLLYRFSGDSLEEGWKRVNKFKDVNQSYYYAEAIEWAYRNHIVDGYGTYAFGPDDDVTRQQMCKIVASFLTWLETPLAKGESCADVFGDYDEIAPWAVDSVEAMVAAGLIQGDGVNMNPNQGANRAQFCVLLVRLAEYIDNYVPVEPTEPTEPTDPEPTDPEPTEPEHVHNWKMNKGTTSNPTKGDVTIDVGERFLLKITCQDAECGEEADVEWIGDPDGVVLIEGKYVTGLTGGMKTTLKTELDGIAFECIVRVRKDDTATEPTDPEPTEPEPTEPEPTEPEPTEPEPTEPEHVHNWKMNKGTTSNPTKGDVTIDVGERFLLKITCQDAECGEEADVEWIGDPDGVVLIEGKYITGLTGGMKTTLKTTWDGIDFECIVRVRKDDSATEPTEPEPTEPEPTEPEPTEPEPTEPEPTDPEEPDHEHLWKLNKASSNSMTDGDVSINVGEWFNLRILCRVSGCEENAPVEWTASKEGVVSINGMRITGLNGGKNVTLTAEWEGVTYTCIVRVRKNSAGTIPGIALPM